MPNFADSAMLLHLRANLHFTLPAGPIVPTDDKFALPLFELFPLTSLKVHQLGHKSLVFEAL